MFFGDNVIRWLSDGNVSVKNELLLHDNGHFAYGDDKYENWLENCWLRQKREWQSRTIICGWKLMLVRLNCCSGLDSHIITFL